MSIAGTGWQTLHFVMQKETAKSHCHEDPRDKTRQMVCAGQFAPTTSPPTWLGERRTKRSGSMRGQGVPCS